MSRAAGIPRRSTASRSGTTLAPRGQRLVAPSSIIAAMDDPLLFSHPSIGHPFTNVSWNNWKNVLKAGDGLPMTPGEAAFFKSISGGREPPTARVREQWWVVGRRGGMDRVAS